MLHFFVVVLLPLTLAISGDSEHHDRMFDILLPLTTTEDFPGERGPLKFRKLGPAHHPLSAGIYRGRWSQVRKILKSGQPISKPCKLLLRCVVCNVELNRDLKLGENLGSSMNSS